MPNSLLIWEELSLKMLYWEVKKQVVLWTFEKLHDFKENSYIGKRPL
jgi:hypothetical protein